MNVEAPRFSEGSSHEAGHMFYLDETCLAAFKADVDGFLEESWVKS